MGVEAAPLGPDVVGIGAFPSFLHRLDPIAFVSDVLSKPERELADAGDEELLHAVLDTMACKAAVKAGDPLTPAEIDALLVPPRPRQPQQQLPPRPPDHAPPDAGRLGEAVQADGVLIR